MRHNVLCVAKFSSSCLLERTGIEEESLDFEEGSKEDLMSPPELPTSTATHANSSLRLAWLESSTRLLLTPHLKESLRS